MLLQTLADLLEKWLKPTKVSQAKIYDLIFLEQFLADLEESTQKWVKLHQLKMMAEALCLAEDYDSAHANPQRERNHKGAKPVTLKTLDKRIEWKARKSRRISQPGIICFHCGQPGHMAQNCFTS